MHQHTHTHTQPCKREPKRVRSAGELAAKGKKSKSIEKNTIKIDQNDALETFLSIERLSIELSFK